MEHRSIRLFLGDPTLLQNSKREFKEWIERDRNHPSVIIWDVKMN